MFEDLRSFEAVHHIVIWDIMKKLERQISTFIVVSYLMILYYYCVYRLRWSGGRNIAILWRSVQRDSDVQKIKKPKLRETEVCR